MTFEIKDGMVRINSQYSVKVNRGNYNMEDYSTGMSIEFPIEDGGSIEDVTALAQRLNAELATTVKLTVYAQLGLNFKEIADGVIVADYAGADYPAPAATAPTQAPAQAPAQGYGNKPFKPPADLSQEPRYNIVWDGQNVEVIDLRRLKTDGAGPGGANTFKANAADFRIPSLDNKPLWLVSSDGQSNVAVVNALQAAGIAV